MITKTFPEYTKRSGDALRIRHSTDEVAEFMLAFGMSRAAISLHPGDFKLHLRLGRPDKARYIVLKVTEEGEAEGIDLPSLQSESDSSREEESDYMPSLQSVSDSDEDYDTSE